MISLMKLDFNATEDEINSLKAFIYREIDNDYTVSVKVNVDYRTIFMFSIFQHDPYVRFAYFDIISKEVVQPENITKDIFDKVIEDLGSRYQHALTMRPPYVNRELFEIWKIQLGKTPMMEISLIEQNSNQLLNAADLI